MLADNLYISTISLCCPGDSANFLAEHVKISITQAADASLPGVEGPDATLEHPSTDQGQPADYQTLTNPNPSIHPSLKIQFRMPPQY